MLRDDVPEMEFFDADPAKLIQSLTAAYEAAFFEQTGQRMTLYPGDRLRVWLYTVALMICQGYNLANLYAKRNFLQYADGAWLDNLSATRAGPLRLPASRARCTMRFTFSAPMGKPLTIPKGTRVSPDGALFFATTETAVAQAGSVSCEVEVEAQEQGAVANGYAPGKVSVLIDPLPYVARVANLDVTQGGADIETDANYRERIYISPEGFSVAGPRLAYVYRALQYSQLIKDVVVHSPEPGIVRVVPVLEGPQAPSQTFLDGLYEFLSDREFRPLTDKVLVEAPTFVDYDISLTYYINASDLPWEARIRADVAAAVESYAIWQKSAIGRDLNPDELVRRIREAGAKRAVVHSPVYTVMADDAIPVERRPVDVVYGGVEVD